MHTNMEFKCKCEEKFLATFDRFKNKNKRQCNICGNKRIGDKLRTPFTEVKRYIEGEEGRGCKLISEEYKGSDSKILIECKCTEIFPTTFSDFKYFNKRQCNKCGNKNTINKLLTSYQDVKGFIEIESQSGCKLLSTEFFGVDEDILVKCPCGGKFTTTFYKFKTKPQRRCKICSKKASVPEKMIINELTKMNIGYVTQHKITKCRNKLPLPFDFFINNKILLEYDGEQHFMPRRFGGVSKEESIRMFERNQENDKIKDAYCINNNIPLIRIPYWEEENIINILHNVLHFGNENKFLVNHKDWSREKYIKGT